MLTAAVSELWMGRQIWGKSGIAGLWSGDIRSSLKRSIKSAIRAIAADRGCGEPLRRELEGLWKYRVRRFRIVYSTDPKTRALRLMAVGHRRNVYKELAARVKSEKEKG
jgi:mRNA interferase RelE/StbE